MRRMWVFLLLMFLPLAAWAQTEPEEVELEEIVVTATRSPVVEERVGSAVSVITEEEIKVKGYTLVKDVLKGELGVDIASTGGPGSMTYVFLRGMAKHHTLVMIDGMAIGDPSQFQLWYDLANLTVDDIERIEIVRGPQSVLYGSRAIGGVINIITKRGKGKPTFTLGLEGGSYDTFRQFLSGSGEVGKGGFSFALSHTKTHGFSAADEDLPGNKEDDGWENLSFSGRADFRPSDLLALGVKVRLHEGKTELDDGGGPYKDVEDYYIGRSEFIANPYVSLSLFNNRWKQKISMGVSNYKRKYRNDPWGDSEYHGRLYNMSWQNELEFHKTNRLIFGGEYVLEEMTSSSFDKSAYTFSFYLEDQINLFDLSFTTLGIRWDKHKEFGDQTTLRATQAFVIQKTGTKLRGSIGTGFRAPSLYELYAPPYSKDSPVGNPGLDPEKSTGWDIGVEQEVGGMLKIGVTYFENEVEDLIEYVSSKGYVNIEKAKSSGIETILSVEAIKAFTARLTYTYTETKDEEGKQRIYIPFNKVGVSVRYDFKQKGHLAAHVVWTDDRRDYYWIDYNNKKEVKLDDYWLVNLSGSLKIYKNFEVFARIENLLDEDYEEVYGYGTPGFSVYGGIRATF